MELRIEVALGNDGEKDAIPLQWNLEEELSELDNVELRQAPGELPQGAKGIASLTGLLVHVPVSGIVALIQFLRAWAVRTGRTVEVSIAGDSIKITGASKEQQDRVIEAWLVRHASGT